MKPIELVQSRQCCTGSWEEAYARFETPEQEIRKFLGRLKQLGARAWSRDAEIVELFCGRGSGLHALSQLGFTKIEGVDLSATLLGLYAGPARCFVGDCRALPFSDGSKDVVIIQGGLHHLPDLPSDLDRTLREARRVIRKGGILAVVEPWRTPFLEVVHAVCANSLARRIFPKIEALATMIEHERDTYEQWLDQPELVLNTFATHFDILCCYCRWGKLTLQAQPRLRH